MVLALVATLVFGQTTSVQVPKENSKELSPKTRPIIEVPPFKDLPCVSVSEYKTRDKETDPFVYTRVYRFTYKANFDEESKRLTELLKKDNWKHDEQTTSTYIIERDIKDDKRLYFQAMIVRHGKFVFDSKVRSQTRVEKTPGWVGISLNERITGQNW